MFLSECLGVEQGRFSDCAGFILCLLSQKSRERSLRKGRGGHCGPHHRLQQDRVWETGEGAVTGLYTHPASACAPKQAETPPPPNPSESEGFRGLFVPHGVIPPPVSPKKITIADLFAFRISVLS